MAAISRMNFTRIARGVTIFERTASLEFAILRNESAAALL
jgi:hypothetical protein